VGQILTDVMRTNCHVHFFDCDEGRVGARGLSPCTGIPNAPAQDCKYNLVSRRTNLQSI